LKNVKLKKEKVATNEKNIKPKTNQRMR